MAKFKIHVFFTTILVVSNFFLTVEASDQLQVSCKAPLGYAGLNGRIQGTLNLSVHPDFPAPAKLVEGDLLVQAFGSKKAIILNKKEKFFGQYDRIGTFEYVHMGSIPDAEIVIYADFSGKDQSYIEFESHRYLMDCQK